MRYILCYSLIISLDCSASAKYIGDSNLINLYTSAPIESFVREPPGSFAVRFEARPEPGTSLLGTPLGLEG